MSVQIKKKNEYTNENQESQKRQEGSSTHRQKQMRVVNTTDKSPKRKTGPSEVRKQKQKQKKKKKRSAHLSKKVKRNMFNTPL